MKHVLLLFFCFFLLAACSSSEPFTTEWGESSEDNQSRLEDHDIPFEVREGKLFIQERHLDQAVTCCS